MATPRRLVFGDVADRYDRHRPTYPSALISDLIADAALAPGERAVEVGAGTGKATELLAAHGVSVVAVEPSSGMAAIARRKFATTDHVQIVESDFEHWDPAGERFGLVYSAQAWHWIDPAVRYQRARAALGPGGLLAAFWNRPQWTPSPLRDAMIAVYAELAPDLSADGSMHPASVLEPGNDEDWASDLAGVTAFTDARTRTYASEQTLTGEELAGVLGTLSEYRLLTADRRETILTAARDTVDAHGGTVALSMATLLCTARAV
jgi:trans-aconitate methyltransferase